MDGNSAQDFQKSLGVLEIPPVFGERIRQVVQPNRIFELLWRMRQI
jgi:hypothetical protein